MRWQYWFAYVRTFTHPTTDLTKLARYLGETAAVKKFESYQPPMETMKRKCYKEKCGGGIENNVNKTREENKILIH